MVWDSGMNPKCTVGGRFIGTRSLSLYVRINAKDIFMVVVTWGRISPPRHQLPVPVQRQYPPRACICPTNFPNSGDPTEFIRNVYSTFSQKSSATGSYPDTYVFAIVKNFGT